MEKYFIINGIECRRFDADLNMAFDRFRNWLRFDGLFPVVWQSERELEIGYEYRDLPS